MSAGPAPGRAADRARTVFFGSGPFAVPILDAVAAHPGVDLVGIVTTPDRPAGRGRLLRPTPVAFRARSMWVPLLQPSRLRDPDAIAEVAALAPALGVLADYGQIVPRAALDLPVLGLVGVHPSLLPRHRGATPIQATIREGDEVAGVTTYLMDEGVDTGPVLAAQQWPLTGTETSPELELVRTLNAAFPGDPGIVVALLMNLVTLRRGEGLFVPAGVLHAYLEGLGVELMAASDNVLRGGLTPKHVDAAELVSVLDDTPGLPPVLQPRDLGDGVAAYDVPVDDFALRAVRPRDGAAASISLSGPAIVLATSGSPLVAGRASHSVATLAPGKAVLVTPDEGHVLVSGEGNVFVALPGR